MMIYPKHVAIIPDGNRTRARENNVSQEEGYLIAYQKSLDLIEYTFTNTDTKVFTIRGLSTENTKKRPKEEFDFLMTMYKLVGSDLDDFLIANKINFKRIGNPEGITNDFKEYLQDKEKKTKCDSDRYVIFGVNYGGRDEIIRGIKKLVEDNQNSIEELKHKLMNLTEEDLSSELDLGKIPTIDLVIRTKGEEAHRTSGFMARRIGYAELYFTPKKCPEFEIEDYKTALNWFNEIESKRNFGK